MAGSARQALARGWRSARRRFGGSAVVLIYHRIATLERDPELLTVTPERFYEQVRVLSRDFEVVPVGELFELVERGRRIPRRTVAITFDDGYADALHAALPVLRAHGAPSTMFVSSGALDSPHEYWWDQIEQICLHANELPERIELDVGGARFSAQLGSDAVYSADAAAHHAAWNVTEPPPTARHRVYLELGDVLKPLAPAERAAALASLREQTGVAPVMRDSHRTMTASEIALLATDPLAEIGGHTVDHQMLSACSADEQRHQVADDKRRLEELCGHSIASFSYPHGTFGDFDADSVRIVREAGYLGACTAEPGALVAWGDRFRVPRYLPRSQAPDQLAKTLSGWLDGDR